VKFSIERDALAEAVAWAARNLPARPMAPQLAGLLIDTTDSGLVLSSFDYEVSSRVDVVAAVAEPGRVLVSGRLLSEIAKLLPAAPVVFTATGNRLEVKCGRASFALPTLSVDDYPQLPELPGSSGTVSGATLAAAVSQVAIAAGRDDTLPGLTGIRLEIDGRKVTMAATDRFRLAVREFEWNPEAADLVTTALVPARTLADIAKSLSGCDAVQLSVAATGSAENLLGFDGDGRRTTTRLIDGPFPEYRRLLPAESNSRASVDTSALIDAVKRVALVIEKQNPVRLSFTAGELRLSAGTGDDAQADEFLDATLEGDPIEIAFNHGFLLDGLSAIDAPVARFSFTVSNKPAIISGAGDHDSEAAAEYKYLLMPVRLSGS